MPKAQLEKRKSCILTLDLLQKNYINGDPLEPTVVLMLQVFPSGIRDSYKNKILIR